MSIKIKRISEVPVLEQIEDSTNILVEDNGSTHRLPVRDLVGNSDPNRHAEYFDITNTGEISLKPEYRGATTTSSYPYAISDNGLNNVGSKNAELPKDLVIPEEIDGTAVFKLADAMFMFNDMIESIAIPNFITKIPIYFARTAHNLKEVKGTVNVKEIECGAFMTTSVRKLSFPKLETLTKSSSGNGWHFKNSCFLVSADLGNVTLIPKQAFSYCERLSCVHNAKGVTSVEAESFMKTSRLKSLNFLSNLTSADSKGDKAFLSSRVDSELQSNKWWENCTYTKCNIPLRSVFDQANPNWKDKTIDNKGTKYLAGGVAVSAAMIYSALEGKDLDSPEEFIEAVKSAKPSLLDLVATDIGNMGRYLSEGLKYNVVHKTTYNADTLNEMYTALKDGKLVLAQVDCDFAGAGTLNGVVIHGVNDDGELLVQDPLSGTMQYLNINEPLNYATHIHNLIGNSASDFLIVSKS